MCDFLIRKSKSFENLFNVKALLTFCTQFQFLVQTKINLLMLNVIESTQSILHVIRLNTNNENLFTTTNKAFYAHFIAGYEN